MSATKQINKVLREIIPHGHGFRVTWEPTGLGKYQILRVVTPAWKTRSRFQRTLKVQTAIGEQLPPKLLENVLRVSVLTAEELRRLRRSVGGSRRPRRSLEHPRVNGR